MFKEDDIYKDTLTKPVTKREENSDDSRKQTKKTKKKVSFSPSLIRDPSGPNYEHGETSDSEATWLSQEGSKDLEGSEESESDEETKGLTFVEDT